MAPEEFQRRFMSEPHTDLITERDRDRAERRAAEDEFMLGLRWEAIEGDAKWARVLTVRALHGDRILTRWYVVNETQVALLRNSESYLWHHLARMQHEMLRTVFPEEVA